MKTLGDLLDQRPEGLLDDELNQIIVGVVTAATLAGKGIGTKLDLPVFIDDRVEFQQTLVDGSEMPNRQVPVIDPCAMAAQFVTREAVD